ncbi:L-2-hydroxyglutarate oxidase [Falsigemmobacter faecalis]|uniref:L-2-hydroxyglutarate oxidase n=1 Tax=Falsigemmobacter faecalis TaxID=2488730 RepID=A0A3P3DES0_9RHOB|nr:L-2-hydroxyglutarate oxidase [Falsigemmobacter faecalis]RRH72779.1 L-2-hydroxyglutarate oxidase [Falsigemmobacter faecalis]
MTTGPVFDTVIIGAGIIGAALGAELSRRQPGTRILVAEKESRAAFHQTGRNSGVVHSGIYYTPGSLKARFCREGLEETRAFCTARGIGYEARGKLIVATDAAEDARMQNLITRAAENGVEAYPLDRAALRALEPNVTGVAALDIPSTAITDYTGITRSLLADVEAAGGELRFHAPVTEVARRGGSYAVTIGGQQVQAGRVVACAGLATDRVAKLMGIDPGIRILPFRGEYFVLPQALSRITHRMIYPVPDPALPFLGVHLTPMIDGTMTVGPNAVLSFAREKYGHFSVDLRDSFDSLGYPGLWRLLAKHPKASFDELRASLFRRGYLRLVQKYSPSVQLSDLSIYRSANRAQAVRRDGSLVDDFLIKSEGGLTAVLNAPSPAATSAMPIARYIADQLS